MALNFDMERTIRECQPELKQLIRDLCAIPAPSHHEEARAAFCLRWFRENGCGGAFTDDALNVICPWNDTGKNGLTVFMAHTDTVFPDMEPMPFAEKDGYMFCPGVTDDTASLAVMMICARHMIQNARPGETGVLFVANSCEEGLGNLKGSRKIVETYGGRIRALITLDGTQLPAVVTRAVGSHRYRVSARTEGGHSFSAFGKPNAIHRLAGLIQDLYGVDVPYDGDSKTTYNVGMISGGTSVNTIAQQAEMLYEYRSDSLRCLGIMRETFLQLVAWHNGPGTEISVELIGDRPCAGDVDARAQQGLVDCICASIREILHAEPVLRSGSTDANAALAAGIPAVCISVCNGGKCHTRQEWLDVASLQDGCRLLMQVFCNLNL